MAQDLSGRTLGEYILREQIGEGGYAAVYRGEQPFLERNVAIKVLHEERLDNDSRERFLREARLASQLNHPYAAQVFASGVEDQGSLLWIAMELVHGVSLHDWLHRHGPMSAEQFGPFFECLCKVVHFTHQRGIIHRDLTPSNIMVVDDEGRPFPKLVDFGIAKSDRPPELAPDSSDSDCANVKTERLPVRPRRRGRINPCYDSESRRRLTPPDGCVGTRPYMAPEQRIGASAVGPEADIFALGVVAYQTITGRLPFAEDGTNDNGAQHQRAMVPLGDAFPRELELVLRCALDQNPQARHQSALDLASDLLKALRASKREHLRTSAQQWYDRAGAPGLLWGADVLEETLYSVPPETLSPLECSFVAESQRRIRRVRWIRRSVVAFAVVVAIGVFLYRTAMQTQLAQEQAAMQTQLAQEQARSAQKVLEATITQSELEQGRSGLLHSEPDARRHLTEAYRRDHSPSTAFMLARALQPRLAEQARFASTFERMWSAAFSPNGMQLVTTDDRNAQIWDAQSNRLLFTLNHGDSVYHAVYSADGTRVVTGCGDGAVRIWDAVRGVLLREFRHDTVKPRYRVVALSPDGRLVVGLDLRMAHVWDVNTGTLVTELRVTVPSSFPSLAFSADGRWLAMSTGNDAQVLDAKTWTVVHNVSGLGIHSLSWDPTGPHLVTGSAVSPPASEGTSLTGITGYQGPTRWRRDSSSPAPTDARRGTQRVHGPRRGRPLSGLVLDTRCQGSRAPSRASSLRSAPPAPLDRARGSPASGL